MLDSTGKIASTMVSAATNLTAPTLTRVYYIDLAGTNAVDAGSIIKPFKTLTYALSKITTNAVLILVLAHMLQLPRLLPM